MIKVLVVEDDKDLQELFVSILVGEGYEVYKAKDGIEAFDVLDQTHIDLVVCDIMMPRMDGFEMIKEIKNAGYNMPILIISSKDSFFDKRTGFKLGIDDYMVKPVDVQEMLWRIEAVLRRSQIISETKVMIKKTTFDRDTLTVSYNNQNIQLVQKKFFLLLKLVSAPNRIFTRRQIMDDIWGVDSESDSHTLDVHISRLREKFKDNEDFEIITVRGLGYKVIEKQDNQNA